MSDEEEVFTYEPEVTATTALGALGWLVFAVALLCAPAIVWAVYGWAL